MKGFKISEVHLPPVHKIKVKRHYYRAILVCSAGAIWIVHEYSPGFEMHVAFATNLLFALDPTV